MGLLGGRVFVGEEPGILFELSLATGSAGTQIGSSLTLSLEGLCFPK